MHHLSKSRLISAWQCAKRLWLEINARDEQILTPNMQRAFAIGHRAGAAAQTLFPEGHLIKHDHELDEALNETENLLAEPGPITLFEATFQTDGVLIRADVLIRDEQDRIRLIEVKASTSVKEYHLNDCAIQLWVLEQLCAKGTRFIYAVYRNSLFETSAEICNLIAEALSSRFPRRHRLSNYQPNLLP
jgi:hypothetical protein